MASGASEIEVLKVTVRKGSKFKSARSGLSFRCRAAGPEGGEPVICLHGFPATSAWFNLLLEAGAAAGFRMFAPDQRGYSPGARPDPADTRNYHYDLIVGDVVALANALGLQRFHLVGHDHGCLVGWCVSARYPQRVASFTAMSIPHPAALAIALHGDPAQIMAVQYFHFCATCQGKALKRFAAELGSGGMWTAPGFTDEVREEFAALFSQPGALRAALNWYNGAMESQLLPCPPVVPGSKFEGDGNFAAMKADWIGSKPEGHVQTPVLHLWGSEDKVMLRSAIEASADMCTGEYKLVEITCGHSMLQEAGDQCVHEILAHCAKHRISTIGESRSAL